MDIEDDLSRLLGAGADRIHVPVQTIVAEAAARGRKLRRRRRITRALGAVAAVALLTGGVAAFGSEGSDRSQAPATNAPSASAVSVLGPTDPPVNGKVATSGAGLLGILAELLPDSTRFTSYSGSGHPDDSAMMRVDVDFGDHLPSTVTVELRKDWVKDVCPQGDSPQARACIDLPVGEHLYQDSVPGDAPSRSYRIHVRRKDGSAVELHVYSGQLDTGTRGNPLTLDRTRQEPPQTSAFWVDVAKSPLWSLRVPVDTAKDGANRASAAQQ
ncbi:hypothetical protein [Kitasatospora sp. NPDC093679]|uniref:hypothetical protein n=1 Tax=Kitasatospora sp. NPDC093679 TaxID=3154983 RepID=UPI00343A4644